MDFAALPPEVNSALIYTGPGSAPMVSAAASWDSLAGELYSVADQFGSVIGSLISGPWQGSADFDLGRSKPSPEGRGDRTQPKRPVT